MKRFSKRLLAALVGATLALTACGSGGSETGAASEGGGTPIRVAFTPGSGTLPVHMAAQTGTFEDNGLIPEFTEGLDLATYIGALDRQFDIVMTSPTIFLSAAERLPLVAIAGGQITVEDAPNSVLITNDDSIQSVADLAGKRVAVPTLTGTGSIALQYLIQEAGVDLNDVDLVQVTYAEHAAQLSAGNVDAVVSAIPFFTPLLNEGHRIVVDTMFAAPEAATGATNSTTVFFVTTQEYASENPEVVQAFRNTIGEGMELVEEDEAAAREATETWLGLPAALAAEAPIPAFDADLTPEQLAPWIVIARELGIVTQDLDADELVWSDR